MPRAKSPARKRSVKRTPRSSNASAKHSMQPAWLRTRTLVETMLEVMEKGIREPDAMPAQWERLFGAKSSAVANLEKLVQVLVELHGQIKAQEDGGMEDEPLSGEELSILKEWLVENDSNATSDGQA